MKIHSLFAFLLLTPAMANCTRTPPNDTKAEISQQDYQKIVEEISEQEKSRVIVVMAQSQKAQPHHLQNQPINEQPKIPPLASNLIAQMASQKANLSRSIAKLGGTIENDFQTLPILAVSIDKKDTLDSLLTSHQILSIHPDMRLTRSLENSLDLIKQPQVVSQGKAGAGKSVVIIDTGLDYTLDAFGSCTSPNVPDGCRVAYTEDFAFIKDNVLDDRSRHGTHVAAIVAAVAPDAKLIGLDVFEGDFAYASTIIDAIDWAIRNKSTYDIASINLSLGGGQFFDSCSDDPMAIAISNAKNAGILTTVAAGNNGWTDSLNTPACAPAALSVGATYAESLGSVNWGSCIDSDTSTTNIACFSNSSSFLKMLAPGVSIDAAGINLSGTSQAAPHVAGAIAILSSSFPEEGADEIAKRVTKSSTKITDSRNGLSFPFLDLISSSEDCSIALSQTNIALNPEDTFFKIGLTTGENCSWRINSIPSWITTESTTGQGSLTIGFSVTRNNLEDRTAKLDFTIVDTDKLISVNVSQASDSNAPTGLITINQGKTVTNTQTVALFLKGDDVSGISKMCISENTVCENYEIFSNEKIFILSSEDGLKEINLWLEDGLGNRGLVSSATIVLDTMPPNDGSILATTIDSKTIDLEWSGFSDESSEIEQFVVNAQQSSPPKECQLEEAIYIGKETIFRHGDLAPSSLWGYRICAIDKAGNISDGSITTQRTDDPLPPAPEYLEAGSILLNNGDEYTNILSVDVTIAPPSPFDADSPISVFCIDQSENCTSWTPLSESTKFTFSEQSAQLTLYAYFRDSKGRVSKGAAVDSIIFDNMAPVMNRVSLQGRNGALIVRWAEATDELSGIAGYQMVYTTGSSTPEPRCETGTKLQLPARNAVRIRGFRRDLTYRFRLCAVDRAGNVGIGKVWSVRRR